MLQLASGEANGAKIGKRASGREEVLEGGGGVKAKKVRSS